MSEENTVTPLPSSDQLGGQMPAKYKNRIPDAFLVGLFLVLISSLSLWYFEREQRLAVDEQVRVLPNEADSLSADIKEINQKLVFLQSHLTLDSSWTALAASILQSTPPGVQLTNISLEQALRDGKSTRALKLEGFAVDQTTLSSYRDIIVGQAGVDFVDWPLDNFATGGRLGQSFSVIVYGPNL